MTEAQQLGQFLFDGPLRNLWPLLLFPLLAAYWCNRAAKTFPEFRADTATALALALLPGLISLAFCLLAIGQAIPHIAALRSPGHAILYGLTPVLAFALLLRAAFIVASAVRQLRSLHRLSHPAGEELRRAASAIDPALRVRQLPMVESSCFAAGFVHPTIYVSAGALDRLGEAELSACLLHERAHIRHGDTRLILLLLFVTALAPNVPTADNAYRQARERIADEAAGRDIDKDAILSAILVLMRSGSTGSFAVDMAFNASSVRCALLLDDTNLPSCAPPTAQQKRSILACFSLLCWPGPHLLLLLHFCAGN